MLKAIRFTLPALFLCIAAVSFAQVISQGNPTHQKTTTDKGLQGVQITWEFEPFTAHEFMVEKRRFHKIFMKDFTQTKEVGKPALPCYNELIALPQQADFSIRIISSEYVDYPGFLVFPALKPATDTYGAPEPVFEIDEDFYRKNTFWPEELVKLDSRMEWRDLSYGAFTFHPVQYNPATQTLRVYSRLEFEVVFEGGTRFVDASQHSSHWLSQISQVFTNSTGLENNLQLQAGGAKSNSLPPNYIIVTHTNYLAAAQKLAKWKQQLGYRVELLDGNAWTTASVKNAVHNRYNAWTPKPDYLLIIGDHPEVNGTVVNGPHGTYSTDLFYVCMNGANDYVADMAFGRISVANATQALNAVDKIIAYESNPPLDSALYSASAHAAYFQHQGNGYAERRFAQTAEELRDYMTNTQNFNVNRIYYTGSSVNPTNWNNGSFSAGEPIPLYLRKPTFPWTGNAAQINAAINNGVSYVLHRDHGYEQGWGDPAYVLSNINQLNNGNKTPIVFSINCLTGKYYYGECFAERFIRKYPGGAVGVFAHAEISYSGFNDALTIGMFDAIWDSPGFIPNFTGSGGIKNPSLTSHPGILTMGDVVNQGIIRMTQTWGVSTYTNSLLHYFGDPAMRIFTRPPLPLTAVHSDTLNCGQDTLLQISSNCVSCLATLIVDGETISRTQLSNGSATLVFPPLSGTFATLTISDTNSRPYIDTLVIAGGCPKSLFFHSSANYCLADSVVFSDSSSGVVSSYLWNFGTGAVPATATGIGPHAVTYTTAGPKTVSLTVTGNQSHVSFRNFTMDAICRFPIPVSGTSTITACSGLVQDDGGDLNYSNNTTGILTISPPSAASINLVFSNFNFEHGIDVLNIYDGPGISSPLIGSFTGTALPGYNGTIISSTGSITLQQLTNANNTFAGFTAEFSCSSPTAAPVANFALSDTFSCTGNLSFHDISFNGPSSWVWYFGDGDTSHQRNPSHIYTQSGNYTVSMVVSNSFGSDSISKPTAVVVSKPAQPVTTGAERCKQGVVTLTASAAGSVKWYDAPFGGTNVYTGSNFVTPVLQQTTTFYAENELPAASLYGAKPDNVGGGGYLTAEHYLVFDCFKAMTLVSVKVWAQAAGSRTIQLKNASNQILQTASINIPAGMSRITLNFEVPVGNNLRLVGAGQPNLYRNNAGLLYPYTTPGLFSIKSSSASNAPTSFYYYFYDWEVKPEPCRSNRTPAIANIRTDLTPQAAYSYHMNGLQVQFTNTTTHADGHFWDFGNGITAITANPLHTFNPGTYTVRYVASNNCGADSIVETFAFVTGIDRTNGEQSVVVYPNPAHSTLFIQLTSGKETKAVTELYDLAGRLVSRESHDVSKTGNTLQLDIQEVTPGLYHLMIKTDNADYSSKVLIQR